MPTYEYRCNKCQDVVEIVHSIKESPIITCDKCPESIMERLISHNIGGFVIKGGTESMHWKAKRDHLKKNKELGVKQIERYGSFGTKLKPNVGGLEQDSWSDAAKLAKEAGLSTESYQPFIEKEHRISKTSGVDDAKWKKAKEDNF